MSGLLTCSVAEAYHIVGNTFITLLVVFVNVGNLLLPLGNDAVAELHSTEFIKVSLFGNRAFTVATIVSGTVAVIVTVVATIVCFCWIPRLKDTNTATFTKDLVSMKLLVVVEEV